MSTDIFRDSVVKVADRNMHTLAGEYAIGALEDHECADLNLTSTGAQNAAMRSTSCALQRLTSPPSPITTHQNRFKLPR